MARLVREMGPQARRGRRRPPRTTGSRHDPPVAPNLPDRHLVAERPDTVRLADIGHLPTDEGWLHLAATGDPATREVVGRGMADDLRAGLCVDALAVALQRRRPGPGPVRHGDRGVQYAAEPYRRALERRGIERSMGREGDCPDDAPTESFLASPKKENVHHVHFRTRAGPVFEDVEIFHDRQRLHPASGCRTPAEARAGTEGVAMRAAA